MTDDAAAETADDSADSRVEAMEKQIAQLEAALESSAWSRRIILIAVVILLLIVGFQLKSLTDRLRSDEFLAEVQSVATAQLESNTDEYMRHVQSLAETVAPKVSKAFMTQLEKDTPLYVDAIDKERELLLKNLETRLQEQLENRYETVLDEYEQIVLEEFPEADDAKVRDQIMANVKESMNRIVARLYVEPLRDELLGVFATWDTFPPAEEPAKADLPVEDQLTGYLIELISVKLSGNNQLLAAEKVEAVYEENRTPGESTNEPSDQTSPDNSTDTTPDSDQPDPDATTDSTDSPRTTDNTPSSDAADDGNSTDAATDNASTPEPAPSADNTNDSNPDSDATPEGEPETTGDAPASNS